VAMTPAERKRKQRERDQQRAEEQKLKIVDEGSQFYLMPFSQWAERDPDIGSCDMYMAMAGMEFPSFDDERDPEEFVFDRPAFGDEDVFGGAKGALARAERVVSLLLDTALTLASSVNLYKQNEINARLAELEKSTDVDRATAMKDAVRLNKILNQLEKQVRMPIPQWKVKSE